MSNDKYIQRRLHSDHPVSLCEARSDRFSEKRVRLSKSRNTPTPDGSGNFHADAKIGDAHLPLGSGYFSDPSMAAAIYLYVADVDATYKNALRLGAKSVREPSDQT